MSPDKVYFIVLGVFAVVIGYDVANWLRFRTFTKPEIKLQRVRSTVQMSVFALGFTLSLAAVSFHVNIFEYHPPVRYSDINTVTLEDFTGYRLPNQTLDGDDRFAFITTSILWSVDDNKLRIECLFHPARSYVFNQNIQDRFLLQHELYHFHIAEYHARECRREVQQSGTLASREVIENIISRQAVREQEMQREYDDHTYHGYVQKEQKRWMNKVDSLLNSRLDFANTTITLK